MLPIARKTFPPENRQVRHGDQAMPGVCIEQDKQVQGLAGYDRK